MKNDNQEVLIIHQDSNQTNPYQINITEEKEDKEILKEEESPQFQIIQQPIQQSPLSFDLKNLISQFAMKRLGILEQEITGQFEEQNIYKGDRLPKDEIMRRKLIEIRRIHFEEKKNEKIQLIEDEIKCIHDEIKLKAYTLDDIKQVIIDKKWKKFENSDDMSTSLISFKLQKRNQIPKPQTLKPSPSKYNSRSNIQESSYESHQIKSTQKSNYSNQEINQKLKYEQQQQKIQQKKQREEEDRKQKEYEFSLRQQ